MKLCCGYGFYGVSSRVWWPKVRSSICFLLCCAGCCIILPLQTCMYLPCQGLIPVLALLVELVPMLYAFSVHQHAQHSEAFVLMQHMLTAGTCWGQSAYVVIWYEQQAGPKAHPACRQQVHLRMPGTDSHAQSLSMCRHRAACSYGAAFHWVVSHQAGVSLCWAALE